MSRIRTRLRGVIARSRIRKPGRGGLFLAVVAAVAVILSATLWTRDQLAEARVPGSVCDGLVRTSDARDSGTGRHVYEAMLSQASPEVPEFECDASEVLLRVHPLGKNPDFVRSTVKQAKSGQVPLGEGLQGAAHPLGAWLVVPCPSAGSGAPLFVTVTLDRMGSGGERARRMSAETVVRTARAVTERAGCGGPAIPDHSVPKVKKPKRPQGMAEREYRIQWVLNANVPVPSAGADVCGLLPASAFQDNPDERAFTYSSARTPPGGPFEFCQTFNEEGKDGYGFGVASGDLLPYLRVTSGDVNATGTGREDDGGHADISWLDGRCGDRTVLFHANMQGSRLDVTKPRRDQVLRAFADAYAARNGCSVAGSPA